MRRKNAAQGEPNAAGGRFAGFEDFPGRGFLISVREAIGARDARRDRAIGQSLLLAAGFLVLVGISALSVILVDRAREDNTWVVHTVQVENQISTLLLRLSTAESTARGYLLTEAPHFLNEYQATVANIHPDIDKLIRLAGDNPVQIESARQLREPVDARLDEFAKAIDFANRHDTAGGITMLRNSDYSAPVRRIEEITRAMRTEEERLFALRNQTTDRTERLA